MMLLIVDKFIGCMKGLNLRSNSLSEDYNVDYIIKIPTQFGKKFKLVAVMKLASLQPARSRSSK